MCYGEGNYNRSKHIQDYYARINFVKKSLEANINIARKYEKALAEEFPEFNSFKKDLL